MNNNRDYFTKPVQSGSRSSNDYGRTRIGVSRERISRLWCAGILLIVLYFVVQFAR
jgi:hypothetical protein